VTKEIAIMILRECHQQTGESTVTVYSPCDRGVFPIVAYNGLQPIVISQGGNYNGDITGYNPLSYPDGDDNEL
jgi:hypothetical protein